MYHVINLTSGSDNQNTRERRPHLGNVEVVARRGGREVLGVVVGHERLPRAQELVAVRPQPHARQALGRKRQRQHVVAVHVDAFVKSKLRNQFLTL
jgi:hypothetical protein